MQEKDQRSMLQTFHLLDKNGDGTLNKEEILTGIIKSGVDDIKAGLMLEKIFEELDVNNSGRIDFVEFTTAATNYQINFSKE